MIQRLVSSVGLLALLLLPVAGPRAQATTVPEDPAAARAVDVDVLKAELRPLVKEQVQAELDAWMAILQAKATEIAQAEVAAMTSDSTADTERAVALRLDRDALIARVNAVIAALEAKKGDVEEATAYVDSIVVGPPITGVGAAWSTLQAWLVNPEGGLALAKSVGLFLAILIAFTILARILAGILDRTMVRVGRTSNLLRSFFVNTVRKVTVFIGLVIALSQLGVDIGPLLAAIGAAGFVIGFALQGTLSNFAAGVMIMLYRPFEIGDVVTAGGVTGKVEGMTLVSTTMKTPDNQTIVVPNGSIWGDVITNITANDTRRVDLVFGIGYKDDLALAEAELRDLVTSHPLVLADPEPTIRVNELGSSSVNFIVRPWAKTADYWTVYWDLMRAVKERFDEKGISIPFPQQDVYLHQVSEPEKAVG